MRPTRLPVPHLFMGLSAGIFTLLSLAAFLSFDAHTIAATAAFPAFLTAMVRARKAGRHGRGRSLLGLVAGLLTGFAGAATLVGFGLLHPGSPHVIFLPLVFATLGTVLGLSAGNQRPVGGAADLGLLHEPSARPDLEMVS